jgi:hypothetical protein
VALNQLTMQLPKRNSASGSKHAKKPLQSSVNELISGLNYNRVTIVIYDLNESGLYHKIIIIYDLSQG